MKKGVSMDGHEHSDVVKYQNETFLPLMAKHERQMVRWTENKEGTFEHVEHQLLPREKRIIPLFQDKSSFHASEYKAKCLVSFFCPCTGNVDSDSISWERLHAGEEKLMKKGCGQIIHVSDFIKEETVSSLSKIKMI